jgi:hypothetical protein
MHRNFLPFVFVTCTLSLSACIPNLISPPVPRVASAPASDYLSVEATVNGEPVELAPAGQNHILDTPSYNLAIGPSPDMFHMIDKSEDDAYGDFSVLESLQLNIETSDRNPSGLAFSLLNKSENAIQIIWDETAIVGLDGSASRVVHEGVRYADRENSQPPANVPPNARIDDFVVPSNAIYYSSNGGWDEEPLFKELSIGDRVSLFLVVMVDGEKQNLNFNFIATKPFSLFTELPEAEAGN